LRYRHQERYHESLEGGIYSAAPVPIALQICKESRNEALKRYSPAFTGTYIDFKTDVILITNPDKIGDSPVYETYCEDIDQIYFMAASLTDWSVYLFLNLFLF